MLKNMTWQPVPGKEEVLLYPLICKPSFFTSNTFIFQTPEIIMVIDPGNLAEQVDTIRQIIGQLSGKNFRPVMVYLTHCHVDHCFDFLINPSMIAPDVPVFVVIQENGFNAVKQKDRELTGSGRYRQMIPEPNIDVCILSAEERRFNVSRKLMLNADMHMELNTETLTTSSGNKLSKQEITFNGLTIKVYYTPGHSPDSISFQIGNILFTGDCLFATDYFIAGLPGWSKQDTLMTSENLLWLIENEKISMVAQGHGEMMKPDQTTERLKRIIRNLPGMVVKKELDLPAIITSSEHAVDVSREVHEIMIMMTESLRHVVHYLEYLEESAEASKYAATLDSKKFGQIFRTFNDMIDEMNSGKIVEGFLVYRSAALFSVIKHMLEVEGLEHAAGQTLITRLQRLLDDFIQDSGGLEIKNDLSVFDVGTFINSIIMTLTKDIRADQSIFNILDDEQAFITSLIERIACKSIFNKVEFSIIADSGVLIQSDRERLAEIIEIIIELMVEEGSRKIVFNLSQNENKIIIAVDGGLIPRLLVTECHQKRSLKRRLGWINGSFCLKTRKDLTMIVLTIPVE
jgi:glyoxylase-like metal-dependent hydrolase (beta-lactamase superfamily II)